MEKIYLVTGAAGFIGSHICEELLKEPSNIVIGVDNFYSGKQSNIDLLKDISSKFIFYKTDICNHEEICQIFKKHNVQYVFHEAAIASVQTSIENPLLTNEVNIKGSLNILEASRKNAVKRFFFASSAAIYGDEPTLPKDEKSITRPISPYGLEKFVTEQYMKLYASQYGLECIALRYFNVYGPRQDPHSEYSGVISIFDNRIRQKLPITIYGDGEQYRDFIYVKDVAKANIKLMDYNLNDNNFLVVCTGSGKSTTINRLVEVIKNRYDSNDIQPSYKESRMGDIKKSVSNNNLLSSIIGEDFQEIENCINFL
ncbi:SDR family NAD(P)-dependent oxidoreductase [Acinetobacter sp. ANC 3882]|uniref:SDR family NAD(P)-dependent oxidoreductase n=1 Tax=Acinetobacter sp. ANC 3882 TaxID=2923423 RepID=UPI001F4BA92B|nr:SDR family NAD(P)-dependent oxidoreductase [Acinetobacter sp. ANC 3882]MCH7315729.1 SDR family NAD(P)-dependent oxidoreductase [Acinetobacter sp. ANC 3882]